LFCIGAPHELSPPNGSRWSDVNKRQAYLKTVEAKLGLRDVSDWYFVKAHQLRTLGGSHLLKLYNNSLSQLLVDTYPEHQWDKQRLGLELPPTPPRTPCVHYYYYTRKNLQWQS